MDDGPTQPEGFILTKQKANEQATEHFQIIRPPNLKTGVWKFINFFIRHKHQKRILSGQKFRQKNKISDSPDLFTEKDNGGFLEEDHLREDYGLCLLSEELGNQSTPFDRELLMENDKVESENNPGEDAKVRMETRSFFHKMSLEGLMKLFADLHRKKRARELAKRTPSITEEISPPLSFDQPCCLERVERHMRVSSTVSLKRETTTSRTSSATILETAYIKTTNMVTPANSPQKVAKLKRCDTEEEDSDETLNLLESVRTKLADYLNAEESTNSLKATYNDSTHNHEMIEDDWSRKVATTLDNDSLKYDTSCDDIPSIKNNSHHTLNEVHDATSKESICSKQSLTKEDDNTQLNQSFLEDAINSEIIPPLINSEETNSQHSIDTDPQLDFLISTSIEEASTCKSYSYHDCENLGEKRLIQYQLLHVMPFTDQLTNPMRYLQSQDNETLPKMLSCQQVNVAPNLNQCSLVQMDTDENDFIKQKSEKYLVKDQSSEACSISTINSIETCDRAVYTVNKTIQLCTTGVGSKDVLKEAESKRSPNSEVFGEDLIILEDSTPALEATRERKFEVVAVQRGSQDIMDEEEPYLMSDKYDDISTDDFHQVSKEELVYVMESDEVTVLDAKDTELLFVCKYVDDNEAKTYDEVNEQFNQKSGVSLDEASQTKDVIILEKEEVSQASNERGKLVTMIQNEIENNLEFALQNKDLTMVTAEDQVRTSQEILDTSQRESKLSLSDVKHTPTEESFVNKVHLSDSITSDLLSNLDLIVLARKDDIGNTGSDSGIYVSKNASRITTLTYRESQTLNQPIADKPVNIEGEMTQEVDDSNYVYQNDIESVTNCGEIKSDKLEIDAEKILHECQTVEINSEESSICDSIQEEEASNKKEENELSDVKEDRAETDMINEEIAHSESETQTIHQKIVDVQRSQEDQIADDNQSINLISQKASEIKESQDKIGDNGEDLKTLASDKPGEAYAQVEEDIKMIIKELLFETEDLKETIIASAIHSPHPSSMNICRSILEDLINNIPENNIRMEAELKDTQEKGDNDSYREVADIIETIVDKVCSTIDARAHKNVISVNYCLVHNHFHDKNTKKYDSRVVRANKSFRTVYKIKGNCCINQNGPKVTVVNLSPISQRFLRSEEKLTNRIRRSAALLMALYEEMRDYSYYSCTSNILCDLYESMSRNERYLSLQNVSRSLENKPECAVADVSPSIFTTHEIKSKVELDEKEKNREELETITPESFEEVPNTSTNNGETSSTVASSGYMKGFTMSPSNSSIYSDSDDEMPLSEILPNLRYTYCSQEEINTAEEVKLIENNIEINAGRDLGLDVALADSISTESIRTEVVINNSENFLKSEDDSQTT